MKRILLVIAGLILFSIAFSSIGFMISLGIGATIVYYSLTSLLKSQSVLGILWWGIVGLFGLSLIISSIPALIGVAAVALLYYGYKELKKEKTQSSTGSGYDDFANFEKEWDTMMSKYD